jgi:hypothetical protein
VIAIVSSANKEKYQNNAIKMEVAASGVLLHRSKL